MFGIMYNITFHIYVEEVSGIHDARPDLILMTATKTFSDRCNIHIRLSPKGSSHYDEAIQTT